MHRGEVRADVVEPADEAVPIAETNLRRGDARGGLELQQQRGRCRQLAAEQEGQPAVAVDRRLEIIHRK